MAKKLLLLTKYYLVDLGTKHVLVDRHYDTFSKAVDPLPIGANKTALTGKHILAHIGKPWIVLTEV